MKQEHVASPALAIDEKTRAAVEIAGFSGFRSMAELWAEDLRHAVAYVCNQMKAEVEAAGIDWSSAPTCETAEFTCHTDPFDQSRAVTARWVEGRETFGTLQVREDSGVYGEYFVTQPHPGRKGQFIEAVVVWGKLGALRSELRLVDE